ncbi:hypothetical protein FH972_021100 [Carpinus fangiana]|uniref:Uncharacterized protein n=1 Tax=Carpinus fangiana TaxID=176857 RepID=A0A5N6KNE8_9ROSI|nr:hypothetical protein FH972_021100 [Carpinus fangiana]
MGGATGARRDAHRRARVMEARRTKRLWFGWSAADEAPDEAVDARQRAKKGLGEGTRSMLTRQSPSRKARASRACEMQQGD